MLAERELRRLGANPKVLLELEQALWASRNAAQPFQPESASRSRQSTAANVIEFDPNR
jgi:hypothetical protein